MKNLIFKYWPLIVLAILGMLISWPLFLPGYFSHHDDLQIMRIFEMKRCFEDLQIPCRWVPDMGYGNGYPLFNYYNPFPYYIGAFLSFFLPFLISAKILFFIPLMLGGISMYFLVKEILGRDAGIVAAALYLFAPYRALDSYVRGAIAESFAMAIIPLVLYFAYKLTKQEDKKYLILFSISLAAFLTSHTIMTLLFLPVLIFTVIYWMWAEKKRSIKYVMAGVFLGIGLSAFFVVPAYFEKNLVQIDNLTKLDLDFRAHFVTLYQLFVDRSWGYGASFPGPNDTISFQIGWPHWILALLSIPAVLFFKRKEKFLSFYLGILFFFALSILMTHNKSAFIWEGIDILRFVQFPWRFLALTIFTASLLVGFLIYTLKDSWKKMAVFLFIIITVVLNWSYFQPKEFYFDLTDKEKLSGESWETQQRAAILDYLPQGAVEPREPAPAQPVIRTGEADIKNFEKNSHSFKLDLDVKSAAVVEIPIFDFPNWKVYENGVEIEHSNKNLVKRISINLPVGNHAISGKLTNTAIRTISNAISWISLVVIFYLIFYGKSRRIFK